MNLSIKGKIFISHFALIVLLIAGLSYHHFNNEMEHYQRTVQAFHVASSHSIVSTISSAISGDNYANIQLPEFKAELRRNEKLLCLEAEGVSDYSSTQYIARYDKGIGEVWRALYPDDSEAQLTQQIQKLRKMLLEPKKDRVKIEFLIQRAIDAKEDYLLHLGFNQMFEEKFEDLFSKTQPFLDTKRQILAISLPATNRNGGKISFVYDISEISDIQKGILKSVFLEFIVATLLSVVLLGFLSYKITSPLNELSCYIANDFESLQVGKVPGADRSDEIGQLSRSFVNLLAQMKNYVIRLEKLSKNDPLTGLLNRRAFDDIFSHLLSSRIKKKVGILYLDIDNFKNYNDKYGHNAGDLALQKVAQSINNSLQRKGDHAFRLGGEEFAVVLSVEDRDQIMSLAERIRKNVETLQIEHCENINYGVVTISVGVFLKETNDDSIDAISMLESADKALYVAKKNGRNRIELLSS